MTRFHTGCSGWSCRDWAGGFYPKGAPSGAMLPLCAQRFGTVGADMTFHRIPGRRAAAARAHA